MTIRDTIESVKKLLNIKTDNDLALKLGVSNAAVSQWFVRGRIPKSAYYKLKGLGIDIENLKIDEVENLKKALHYFRVVK